MPSWKRIEHLLLVALERPRLVGPHVARAMRDPVHELAGSHVVMDDAAARPHPVERIGTDEPGRKAIGCRLPPPADDAGEARLAWPEKAAAHHRVDAVGADDGVERFLRAIGEADRRSGRIDALAANAEAD